MNDKTLYSVLQVAANASAEVIDAAYRKQREALEPRAVSGDEDALMRLRALREAHQTLTNPMLRGRYDASLAHRATPANARSMRDDTAESPSWLRFAPAAVLALILMSAIGWYLSTKQQAERMRIELMQREQADALARAETERERLAEAEAKRAERDELRQKRMEELQYQRWVEQTRREGDDQMRRNNIAQQRADQDEQRQRDQADRRAAMEREREDTAARRRLEEEKRRLRELERQNSRY